MRSARSRQVLSDFFFETQRKTAGEVSDVAQAVRMLNINYGHNKLLMEKCRVLEEYSQLVATTRDCMLVEKDMQAALNQAVDACIEKGILKEFLLKTGRRC